MARKKLQLPEQSRLGDLFFIKNGSLFRKGLNSRAGWVHKTGYVCVVVDGVSYYEHRLVWKLSTGYDPADELDHIDRDKCNNSMSNLREVDPSENTKNKPKYKNNNTGVTGVGFHKRVGKWQARISTHGNLIHLGYFSDFDDAVKARKDAEIKYKFHKTHGL